MCNSEVDSPNQNRSEEQSREARMIYIQRYYQHSGWLTSLYKEILQGNKKIVITLAHYISMKIYKQTVISCEGKYSEFQFVTSAQTYMGRNNVIPKMECNSRTNQSSIVSDVFVDLIW